MKHNSKRNLSHIFARTTRSASKHICAWHQFSRHAFHFLEISNGCAGYFSLSSLDTKANVDNCGAGRLIPLASKHYFSHDAYTAYIAYTAYAAHNNIEVKKSN
jgi:hypothetical protein